MDDDVATARNVQSNGYAYDGPSSSAVLDLAKFSGAATTTIKTVGDRFAASPGLQTLIKSTPGGAPLVCLICLLLSACAVGGLHTSDSRLERNFFRHESQFNALLAEVQADQKLEMIGLDEGRYAGRAFSNENESEIHQTELTRERLARYRRQLRELGVAQVFRGESGVAFKVDRESILNGDSCKGYRYSVAPPGGHRKANLDEYRISEADRDRFGNYSVYKPLKGNWYLYLFVNGSW
jgi:hypothetical protein